MKTQKKIYYLFENYLPTQIFRLLRSFLNEKNRTQPISFAKIYEKNIFGSFESKSRPGSELIKTSKIRELLPQLFQKYKIKSLLDAPCGDFNWMKTLNLDNIDYLGVDIVKDLIEDNTKYYSKPHIKFKKMDVRFDTLPKVDLILCRDLLQHLPTSDIFDVLDSFKKSKSKYLLIGSYPKTIRNWDISLGGFMPINLLKKPFLLGEPLLKIKENNDGYLTDRYLYLYKINDLQNSEDLNN
ncbi:MAG: class I SAM-dependent methyltransferase [Methanobrevibacter sp.]|jgi:hypothetical protein|nr:class I SAM-dependent methyltransferase [Candidatus Methanovirga basalitermitum]